MTAHCCCNSTPHVSLPGLPLQPRISRLGCSRGGGIESRRQEAWAWRVGAYQDRSRFPYTAVSTPAASRAGSPQDVHSYQEQQQQHSANAARKTMPLYNTLPAVASAPGGGQAAAGVPVVSLHHPWLSRHTAQTLKLRLPDWQPPALLPEVGHTAWGHKQPGSLARQQQQHVVAIPVPQGSPSSSEACGACGLQPCALFCTGVGLQWLCIVICSVKCS